MSSGIECYDDICDAVSKLCERSPGEFAEEYDVERKFRKTCHYLVAPISTNLVLSHLTGHIFGLPRSY